MTTPEERAKEIMAWLRQECLDSICTHLDCQSCSCMAFITEVIKLAENDKLEEAAKVADARNSEHCEDDWEIGAAQTAAALSQEIRSLKSKD